MTHPETDRSTADDATVTADGALTGTDGATDVRGDRRRAPEKAHTETTGNYLVQQASRARVYGSGQPHERRSRATEMWHLDRPVWPSGPHRADRDVTSQVPGQPPPTSAGSTAMPMYLSAAVTIVPWLRGVDRAHESPTGAKCVGSSRDGRHTRRPVSPAWWNRPMRIRAGTKLARDETRQGRPRAGCPSRGEAPARVRARRRRLGRRRRRIRPSGACRCPRTAPGCPW